MKYLPLVGALLLWMVIWDFKFIKDLFMISIFLVFAKSTKTWTQLGTCLESTYSKCNFLPMVSFVSWCKLTFECSTESELSWLSKSLCRVSTFCSSCSILAVMDNPLSSSSSSKTKFLLELMLLLPLKSSSNSSSILLEYFFKWLSTFLCRLFRDFSIFFILSL